MAILSVVNVVWNLQLMANGVRIRVLSLYRRILRTGQSWEAENPEETEAEKLFIRSEAREVFRANKHLLDAEKILEHLTEGESRLEMALHYKTPYPRPVNMPPNTITKAWGSANLRYQHTSRPVYIKSLDNPS
ncbi:hypothetical protein Pmani_017454 [Petrolisthes manimaculis]|uniref:Complex 1 LYR protein domain-containing protein n=1 Tax=Petrolisthes manimaculis TaxID=1843537 RepID=A0AAE1U9D9_9EUCA|nr:hypothetical protein Pmani_017454 [Petrolisthes manimaculis]